MAKRNPDVEAMYSGGKFLSDLFAKLSAAVEKRGGGSKEVHRLVKKEGEETLGNLIVGLVANIVTITLDPAKPFIYDKTKDGWTLPDGDIQYEAGEVMFELTEFLKSSESWVKGTVMADRAKELGANPGQKHAEWLEEHQDRIPEEFRKFHLIFPGTLWRDARGDRSVPCLGWGGGRWCLYFFWLGGGWHSGGRLLRRCK